MSILASILEFRVLGLWRKRLTEKEKEGDVQRRNSFLLRRNKRDMEKEDHIWRRKTYFFRGEQNRERKMRNKFGD